jgi:hypothetical protein
VKESETATAVAKEKTLMQNYPVEFTLRKSLGPALLLPHILNSRVTRLTNIYTETWLSYDNVKAHG